MERKHLFAVTANDLLRVIAATEKMATLERSRGSATKAAPWDDLAARARQRLENARKTMSAGRA